MPGQRWRVALVVGFVLLAFALLWRQQGRPAQSHRPTQSQSSATGSQTEATPPPKGRRPSDPRDIQRLRTGQVKPALATNLGVFEGQVISETTRAGLAATVELATPAGKQTVRTDAAGSFLFQPHQQGIHSIEAVEATGHRKFAHPIQLHARLGEGVTGIVISLSPLAHYQAKTTHCRGSPLGRVPIAILAPDGGDFVSATSDTDGLLTFDAPDDSTLEARIEGHVARGTVDVRIQSGGTLLLALCPVAEDSTLAGRVFDDHGRALPNASVLARLHLRAEERGTAPRYDIDETTTDQNGAFRLEVPEATFDITAVADGYAPHRLRGIRAGSRNIELVLRQGHFITGKVTDPDNSPIAGFSVSVSERIGALEQGSVALHTFVDPDGSYRVGPLAPGRYAITAFAPGLAPPNPIAVVLGDGDEVIDLVMQRGGSITGRVVDSSSQEPLVFARVSLEGAFAIPDRSGLLPSCRTNSQGHFLLEGVAAGSRFLLAAAEGHHATIVGNVLVENQRISGPVEIALQPAGKDEQPQIELAGIGAVLAGEDDALVVSKLAEGGGASEAGIGIGDAITTIDGKAVSELGFEQSIAKIRGPVGSSVELGIRKKGSDSTQVVIVWRKRFRS